VGAEDVSGGLLQDFQIQRKAAGPDVGGEHGRADASVVAAGEDAVLVGLATGVVAGVEVFGNGFDGEDADACRESAVEGAMEVCRGDWDGDGEGGDLGEGVDAGVGAARALGENGFAGDALDGLREGALNGGEIGLDLPTVVGGSVVGQDEFPVRHGDDLHGIMTGWLTPIWMDDAFKKQLQKRNAGVLRCAQNDKIFLVMEEVGAVCVDRWGLMGVLRKRGFG
jgi:hypothetical protein